MLHGYLPFKGSNNYETIELIKEGKYKIKPDIEKSLSEGCLDVLHRCLDVNTKTRISMEELADHPWIMHKMFMGEKKAEKEKAKVVIEPIKEEPVKEVKKNIIKPTIGVNKTPVKPGIPGVNRNAVKKWIFFIDFVILRQYLSVMNSFFVLFWSDFFTFCELWIFYNSIRFIEDENKYALHKMIILEEIAKFKFIRY